MLAARASAAKRGEMLRKSVPLKVVLASIVPVRKPAPTERDEPDAEFLARGEHGVVTVVA
jgi:hypothetical protein